MPDKTREYTGGDWSAFNNAQVMADGYIELSPVSDEKKLDLLRRFYPPDPEPAAAVHASHEPLTADNVTAGERNHPDGYVYCGRCLRPLGELGGPCGENPA
jgi:hypothetical protein